MQIPGIFIQCLVFNKTVIPLSPVRYELMLYDSRLGVSYLVRYLKAHIERARVRGIIVNYHYRYHFYCYLNRPSKSISPSKKSSIVFFLLSHGSTADVSDSVVSDSTVSLEPARCLKLGDRRLTGEETRSGVVIDSLPSGSGNHVQ